MATRKHWTAWLAAVLLVFTAAVLHAAISQRIFLGAGTTEVPIGDGTLIIQSTDELALTVTVESGVLHGVLDLARPNESSVRTRIVWKGAPDVLVVSGEISGPTEFESPIHHTPPDETGHGEM
jgi:hypothetical protein